MLRACLRRVRRRWYGAFMTHGAVIAALAALAVLCGLQFAALAFAVRPVSVPLAVTLAVAVVTAAGAGVLAIILAPDDGALARLGDRRFVLQERLSSALEADATVISATSPDPVRRALFADAERCAGRIDTRQWLVLRLPRIAFAVPALAGLALVLALLEPAPGPTAAADDRGPDAAPAARPEPDTAAELRTIAESIARDAEKTSNPRLRTIAQSLDRLGARMSTGAVDRRAGATALAGLLRDAQQAYAQGQTADADRSPTDRIQSALADMTDAAAGEAKSAARDIADASPASGAAAAEGDAPPGPGQEQRRASRPPPEGTRPPPPPGAGVLDDVDEYERGEADPRAQVERAIAEQQRRLRGAAQSAGAAQDAGEGEGDRAGNGSRPLGNGTGTAKSLAAGADMLLPEQQADGGRIRIEIPPDAVHTEVVSPPPGGAGGEWRRIPEGPVERPAPTAEARRALGRYFARPDGAPAP